MAETSIKTIVEKKLHGQYGAMLTGDIMAPLADPLDGIEENVRGHLHVAIEASPKGFDPDQVAQLEQNLNERMAEKLYGQLKQRLDTAKNTLDVISSATTFGGLLSKLTDAALKAISASNIEAVMETPVKVKKTKAPKQEEPEEDIWVKRLLQQTEETRKAQQKADLLAKQLAAQQSSSSSGNWSSSSRSSGGKGSSWSSSRSSGGK